MPRRGRGDVFINRVFWSAAIFWEQRERDRVMGRSDPIERVLDGMPIACHRV